MSLVILARGGAWLRNRARPRLAVARIGNWPVAYERRFGAAPAWFDEIPVLRARGLALRALREGVPLAAADHFS